MKLLTKMFIEYTSVLNPYSTKMRTGLLSFYIIFGTKENRLAINYLNNSLFRIFSETIGSRI